MDVDLSLVEPRAKEKLRFFGALDVLRMAGWISSMPEINCIYESWDVDSRAKPPFIKLHWDVVGLVVTFKMGAKRLLLETDWKETSVDDDTKTTIVRNIIRAAEILAQQNRGDIR
jgi:hypothetical protein